MSEEGNVEAGEGGQQGMQLVPVGTLAVAVVGGQVVGCEVAWNASVVPSAGHAAQVLSTLMQGQMDARWVLRQVARAEEADEETKPN